LHVRCFNPLHCGAVVASKLTAPRRMAEGQVSIPFIAGQWSLRARQEAQARTEAVSIPFIAGQWSLPLAVWRAWRESTAFQSPSLRGSGRFPCCCRGGRGTWQTFQSPSLRGSGRFLSRLWRSSPPRSRFNPLHCGAVVASRRTAVREARRRDVSIPFIAGQWSLLRCFGAEPGGRCTFQSPSLRGSGRFVKTIDMPALRLVGFQSPSLRGSGRFLPPVVLITTAPTSFNPLHCGAVVASRHHRQNTAPKQRVSIPFIAGQWSLRRRMAGVAGSARAVSIPFIAGQWSLLDLFVISAATLLVFQSPSLRGSGRFRRRRMAGGGARGVSIPFIAGQWSLQPPPYGGDRGSSGVSIPFIAGQWSLRARRDAERRAAKLVSIPFIAGQWSLPASALAALAAWREAFQSPSLRGSGRFASPTGCAAAPTRGFNPLHCGAVVASISEPVIAAMGMVGFNPLHCGAVVASR